MTQQNYQMMLVTFLVVATIPSVLFMWCDAFQFVSSTSTSIPNTTFQNSRSKAITPATATTGTNSFLQQQSNIGSIQETPTVLSTLSSYPSILPPPLLSDDEIESIHQIIKQEYQQELDNGFAIFGSNDVMQQLQEEEISTILDEVFEEEFVHKMMTNGNNDIDTSEEFYHSFIVQGMAGKNSGPDELYLHCNGNTVFQTKYPIVSNNECTALIQEAKRILMNEKQITASDSASLSNSININGDNTTTTDNIPTNTELGEVRVSQLQQTRLWLRRVLHTRLFPFLASRYGISSLNDITLQDGLIIGYGYQSSVYGSKAQPIHRDSCLLSINIALSSSDDYTNGGTYFEGIGNNHDNNDQGTKIGGTIFTERGHATCHPGGIAHAGRSVGPNSERWVLVLFCIVRNYPEIVRRCHAKGMMYHQNQQYNLAKSYYQVGLSLKPNDHLLLTSLGRTYMEENHEASTEKSNAAVVRNCLALASVGYDHCMKANMALGRMMLSSRKPRAALRRFDKILEWLHDRDILDPTTNTITSSVRNRNEICWEEYKSLGYDARYYGAQAALISAREAKRRLVVPQQPHGSTSTNVFDWKHHVNIAMERCKILLASNPNDTRVYGMLNFAEGLLDEKQ